MLRQPQPPPTPPNTDEMATTATMTWAYIYILIEVRAQCKVTAQQSQHQQLSCRRPQWQIKQVVLRATTNFSISPHRTKCTNQQRNSTTVTAQILSLLVDNRRLMLYTYVLLRYKYCTVGLSTRFGSTTCELVIGRPLLRSEIVGATA